jgi:serine/threonine-protein kinase
MGYRVERMVGSGGMAHVLAARHTELGTEVAIKVLDPTLLNDTDATERFAREGRAMASLSSKHTVRVYDVGHLESGLPFMVMELLEGEDLGQVLKKRGSLPLEEACECIEQACEAVAEAHAAGIIHRDLKPQNLFLTRVKDKPMIRVLDFGIARSTGALKLETITRIGDMIGTLHYMSPEQIRNSKEVDPRSDVWSLGACFYKLVTGHPPFSQAGEAPLMSAILTAPPTPIAEYRKDVPAVLSSVIMRCLRKPLDERFPSVTDLRKAIDEARTLMLTGDLQTPRPAYKATLPSATDDARAQRAKVTATMPLEASMHLRVPTGPQPAVQPPTPPPPAAPPPAIPPPPAAPPPAIPPAIAPAKPAASAISFVLIIVAVAIGVFVGGLGLLFVLSRRH